VWDLKLESQVSAAFPVPSGSRQTVIITGANAGLGVETTRVIAKRGCDVIMAVRDVAKGQAVAAEIKKTVPNASLTVMKLDLADLSSVKSFVTDFKKTNKTLDILICNAGVATMNFQLSAQGHELMFATNHLGHFLLVSC
jgi:NAD(P)-dependent dehydrogenase (short-subunit alcohol dehydrogenase family)